ncbi:MAG TPA: exopolysaccharide biosynthesis polyprenyl glycosylphosphotransferase [Rhizomicrobium sp.]|nr:exopolysaccharide biosynthesis polyprenyl glycosylphosphotransferase [Rhizomicrobium sp.]
MSVHEQFAGDSVWIGDAIAGRLADGIAAPAHAAEASRQQQALKRLLDLAIALPALLLIAPLLAAIALWVRLDSRGPVLFRQTRSGLRGRPFTILKFRTMTVLENGATVVQATHDDPRITRAGRVLRKASLDELPQLLNVIRGEMSLVGPRPHALAHDIYYAARIEEYAQRQRAKPGITGWAQVHGLRGETPTLDSMRRRVLFDVWYARHASAVLDIEILLRTPFEVLRQRNAR